MPLRKVSVKNIIKDGSFPNAEEITDAREERRTTGRAVATVVALALILLAVYHAWIRRTAVVAGIIIPALIMVLYTAWVLYTARKDKARARMLEMNRNSLVADVVITPPSDIAESNKENNKLNENNLLNNVEVKLDIEPSIDSTSNLQESFHPAILQNQLKPPNLETKANYGRSISVT